MAHGHDPRELDDYALRDLVLLECYDRGAAYRGLGVGNS